MYPWLAHFVLKIDIDFDACVSVALKNENPRMNELGKYMLVYNVLVVAIHERHEFRSWGNGVRFALDFYPQFCFPLLKHSFLFLEIKPGIFILFYFLSFISLQISRQSIDACKDYFRDDLLKSDWTLMVELKKTFEIL